MQRGLGRFYQGKCDVDHISRYFWNFVLWHGALDGAMASERRNLFRDWSPQWTALILPALDVAIE
jgi:hypothetical protein